jgi:lambda family phage portal protein
MRRSVAPSRASSAGTDAMKMNLLDRAISYVSPARGAARIAHRKRAEMLEAFDGASGSHRNANRRYLAGDANAALRTAAKRLRYSARHMERNHPLAHRGISVLASNLIGGGIIPAVAGVKGARRDSLQKLVNDHCDTPRIDAAGRQNLYGMQSTAVKAAVRDGESLMVRRRARSSERLPLPFQISVLECDYFDERVHGQLGNGNVGIEGVEVNAAGAVVAYHLYDRHPGDLTVFSTNTSTRYLAEDVVHLYRIDRPGQAHGVSWLAPVIVRLGDFEDTKDAYILRQKIAACFAAFVTRGAGAGDPQDADTTRGGNRLETVEPGMIEYLDDGDKVEFGTPPIVGDLQAFFQVNGRDIAVGLGMTYEALTGDLSGVNFSSGRMGWLEFHRNLTSWTEQMLMPQMCGKVGQWILDGVRLMASVPAQCRIDHVPPRREMIDPASELKAAAQAARDGLGTRSRFLRSQGYDPETVDNERKEELEREKRLGLAYDTNVAPKAPAVVDPNAPPPSGTKPEIEEVEANA